MLTSVKPAIASSPPSPRGTAKARWSQLRPALLIRTLRAAHKPRRLCAPPPLGEPLHTSERRTVMRDHGHCAQLHGAMLRTTDRSRTGYALSARDSSGVMLVPPFQVVQGATWRAASTELAPSSSDSGSRRTTSPQIRALRAKPGRNCCRRAIYLGQALVEVTPTRSKSGRAVPLGPNPARFGAISVGLGPVVANFGQDWTVAAARSFPPSLAKTGPVQREAARALDLHRLRPEHKARHRERRPCVSSACSAAIGLGSSARRGAGLRPNRRGEAPYGLRAPACSRRRLPARPARAWQLTTGRHGTVLPRDRGRAHPERPRRRWRRRKQPSVHSSGDSGVGAGQPVASYGRMWSMCH